MNVERRPEFTSARASDLTSFFFQILQEASPRCRCSQRAQDFVEIAIKHTRSIIAWAKSPESHLGSQERAMRGDIFSIFGHWLQTSTATGRLSMEDPNLQV